MSLKDGVLREDIGHPAFHPDRDLVDELMAVCGRSSNRLTVGHIFGSLLVVMRAVLLSRHSSGRSVTHGQLHDLCVITARYLSKPPPRPDAGLDLGKHN